jgi:recombination protein U
MSPRGGRRSVQAGASLEALLNYVHQRYWINHHVWIRHNGIAGTWHRDPRRRGKAVFSPVKRTAAPDYYGVIYGRFVAFDAKLTNNKIRWTLGKDRIHQLQYLQEISTAGGCSWFAVEHRPSRRMLLVPIRPDTNKATVDLRSPAEDVLQIADVQGYYDWLGPVLEHWIQRPT